MINISNGLKGGLTVIELITLLKNAPGDISNPLGYVLVPASELSGASKAARDTINYCEEHGFIEIKYTGKKCYEFSLTEKGLSFCEGNPEMENEKITIRFCKPVYRVKRGF
ncbi:hypothetical protein JMN32_08855 [Fulvivirga sp. 29W222]|uniref:Uncharacterized protein n=1 Tax=Fulvivirga marina TaxID=2494733 RepID=A0A937FXX6_9BACT|nr:hypothetical protein [Fulvivirga marina]MBL6446415.1 hypothetical protein [Fulvivirga marina]